MNAIKIIAVPPGEAPQSVREAWVGLVLPLALPHLRRSLGAGVLTGPRTPLAYFWWRLTRRYSQNVGYVVESAVAISILSQQNPTAGQWWQQNTPEYLEPGRRFLFAAEACEEVPLSVWPPAPDIAEANAEKPFGQLHVVFSSLSSIEAHIVHGMLEDHGIGCFLSNDYIAATEGFIANVTGGIQVMVQESDVAQATQILSEAGSLEAE